jgi:Protein of unknown function (DUF1566)
MYVCHRLLVALLFMGVALITACNPVPLSVVASDFSINGVAGTAATTTTTTATATATSSTTASTAGTSAGTTTTSGEQSVTIDLTPKETCSTLTSLVAKVKLAEGVTISPDPAVARDYTAPVVFTVTETYGGKVVYTVTVKGKACDPTKTATLTPADCNAATIGRTGYSLVFKACDANKVATYYDKTECVRDNATGLIWEGKTSSGLRAGGNKYNNLDNTSLLQISANTVPLTTALPARRPTQAEIDAPDNAIGYKNSVNALNLCGSATWRMPTKDELQSIRLAGATTQIDLDWFPNTNLNGYYCTSTQFGAIEERSSVIQFFEKGSSTVDNLLRDGTVWDPTRGALPLRENSVRLVRSAF